MFQLPLDQGVGEGKAMYIDVEGTFATPRPKNILDFFEIGLAVISGLKREPKVSTCPIGNEFSTNVNLELSDHS